jgi:hypothetical protein
MPLQPSTIDISDLIEGDVLLVRFDHAPVPGVTVHRRAVLRIETAGIVSMQHDETLPPMYPCTVLHGADVLGERVNHRESTCGDAAGLRREPCHRQGCRSDLDPQRDARSASIARPSPSARPPRVLGRGR